MFFQYGDDFKVSNGSGFTFQRNNSCYQHNIRLQSFVEKLCKSDYT